MESEMVISRVSASPTLTCTTAQAWRKPISSYGEAVKVRSFKSTRARISTTDILVLYVCRKQLYHEELLNWFSIKDFSGASFQMYLHLCICKICMSVMRNLLHRVLVTSFSLLRRILTGCCEGYNISHNAGQHQ